MEFDPVHFDTSKKIAIITGATGAIGRAIARKIANEPDYALVLPVRNQARATRTVEEIASSTGNDDVYYHLVDLGVHEQIKSLAEEYTGPVDLLINNASVAPPGRSETSEGIEMQWSINVLAYLRLMRAFAPHLRQRAQARIVNVASYFAGGLDMHDPEFRERPYSNNAAYRQSKQAERMLTKAFSDHHAGDGLAVNACHPGDVNSRLSNDLGYGGHDSPDQGADTPVWLAMSPEGINNTGRYFEHRQRTECHFSADQSAVESLLQLCEDYNA